LGFRVKLFAGLKDVPIEVVRPTGSFPGSRYSTWEAAYQDRFHDPRNVRAGGAVPNTGLNKQPSFK